MWCALRLDHWGGQFTVLLIAARQFLGLEQGCNAGATGQGVICPAPINAEFSQQGSRPPAWMRPAHLQDGLTHSHRKRAQWSGGRAAQLRAETGSPLLLTPAPPPSVLGRLGDIQVPTVVLVGGEDDPTTIAGAEAIASGVRRGELRLIERAGHLVEVVRADEVARAILSD